MFLGELREPLAGPLAPGKAALAALGRLGVTDAASLILHAPRSYEDRSRRVPLSSPDPEGRVYTIVRVISKEWFGGPFAKAGKTLKVRVEDGTARAELLCFGRPWLDRLFREGSDYVLSGIVQWFRGELQLSNFEAEPARGPELPLGILPIYPLSAGIQQAQLRRLIRRALGLYAAMIDDELPESIIEARGLVRKADALRSVHFPRTFDSLEKARSSLAFEELFELELVVGRRAMERRTMKRPRDPVQRGLERALRARLPFALTAGQDAALTDIRADLERPEPMARLLQGDVGSGKTLVAFIASLYAIEAGGQAALMAPTELLARQHAETAARLLCPLGVRLGFLSGKLKEKGRASLLRALAAGEIDLVIGTHALFSGDVSFKALRLVVIDEQHRFGVAQRAELSEKGGYPDLIMMSATPIPRSLALTVFGDLSISSIREMPPGRLPVKTHLASQKSEGRVYDFVRRELSAGRQAYFVYPLIGRSESRELKHAEGMFERLKSEVYPEFKGGIIHSRLPEEEKLATMEAFTRGELSYLVSTSVVEVGVDVPNASCMVVEHADRFGLAALHQLRGRVGRGGAQSFCFLVYSDELTEDAKERLKVMLETSDGFRIAEEDLRIRGPGEIIGKEQSGALRFRFADPARDGKLLEEARDAAFAILEKDPGFLSADNARLRELFARARPFQGDFAAEG